MDDQSWTLDRILGYRNITLPEDVLSLGEEHLKSYRHHAAWCLELGREHSQYAFHFMLSEAHLNHFLGLVHQHADFSKAIHSEDDGTGLLCCHDSWDPSCHLFSGPGCSISALDLNRRYQPGQAHPGDRLLKNLHQPRHFWDWRDDQGLGFDLEGFDDL